MSDFSIHVDETDATTVVRALDNNGAMMYDCTSQYMQMTIHRKDFPDEASFDAMVEKAKITLTKHATMLQG